MLGVFQYEPDLGTVLSAGTHQIKVTFNPENMRDYSPSYATVQLSVEKCVPALVWNSHKIRALTYGDPLTAQDHLSATFANPYLVGKFKYFPVVGTILPAGEHWIRVVAAPFDRINYSPAHKQMKITVKKLKPTIRWEKKTVTYPSRLSRQELVNKLFAFIARIWSPNFNKFIGCPLRSCRYQRQIHIQPTNGRPAAGGHSHFSCQV